MHSVMSKPVFTVDSLDISQDIILVLKKAKLVDLRKIITLTTLDIERTTGLSSADVTKLKSTLAQKFLPHKLCTALDLFEGSAPGYLNSWRLSTTCPVIDKLLRGGIPSGVLTEISGESASGKTQLCLQLCISAQVNKHKAGGAAYICTEDVFPSKRLQQLIHFHSGKPSIKNLGDGIFIEHVADFETLEFCVSKKLPTLLNRGVVDLVVIDSVAALFRCHYDVTQTLERSRHLITFAQSLQRLALQYNVPVVCVNQVTSSISGSSNQSSMIPSLGLTWSNQILCRLMLSRQHILTPEMIEHKDKKGKQTSEPTYRQLSLVFAPHLTPANVSVFIDNSGIHGIS